MSDSNPRTSIRSTGLLVCGLLGVALLSGCGPQDDQAADAAADRRVVPATAAQAPSDAARSDPAPGAADPVDAAASAEGTVGGDGSAINLSPLTEREFEAAQLAGELGCTFARPDASPILIAMGDVASEQPSQGILKVGISVERISAPGGFDAMTDGVTFSGAGKTVRVEVTGPAVGGVEAPPRPAVLIYDRADGARLTIPGRWICGP